MKPVTIYLQSPVDIGEGERSWKLKFSDIELPVHLDVEPLDGPDIVAYLMATILEAPGRLGSIPLIQCLVLVPTDHTGDQYRRLGLFYGWDHQGYGPFIQASTAFEDYLYDHIDRSKGEGQEQYFISTV